MREGLLRDEAAAPVPLPAKFGQQPFFVMALPPLASKASTARRCGVPVLNSPVRKITQDARGVEVTSDSVVVRARRVIVTVPRTLAGSIRFDPILPADAAQLIQRIPMGSVIKATLVYDEAFWRKAGLSGISLNVGSPVSSTADGG